MGAYWSTPETYRFYQQHLYDLVNTLFVDDNSEVIIPIKSPDRSVELWLNLSYKKIISDKLNIFGIDIVIILKKDELFYNSQTTTLIIDAYHYNENLKSGAILYKLQHKNFKISFDAKTLNYTLTLIFDPANEHDCLLLKNDIVFIIEPTSQCIKLHIDDFKQQSTQKTPKNSLRTKR